MAILLCDFWIDVILGRLRVDDVQIRLQVGARDLAIAVEVVDAKGLL